MIDKPIDIAPGYAGRKRNLCTRELGIVAETIAHGGFDIHTSH
jgi:hypothetical protein